MNELLAALHWRPDRPRAVVLFLLFASTTELCAAALLAGSTWFGLSRIVAHAAAWGLWFTWLSAVFPLARRHILRRYGRDAYRVAFYWQIVPGVSVGVGQMLAPLFVVLAGGDALVLSPVSLAAISIAGGAILLLLAGFRGIGVAGAGFLYEYVSTVPRLVRSSIYGRIRHPLFLGGVLLSVVPAVMAEPGSALALAVVNLASLPLYGRIEDSRLDGIFGSNYDAYRQSVRGFLPRFGTSRGASPIGTSPAPAE